MQSKRDLGFWDNSKSGTCVFNRKFSDTVENLKIDLSKIDQYRLPLKYARYYKQIIREPSQEAYTYKLWKNRYATFWDDDVMLNEWSNNRMYFDSSDSLKDNMGTAIWFAVELARHLESIPMDLVVILSYHDIYDKHSEPFLDCEDIVNVTFCRAPGPDDILNSVCDCIMVIKSGASNFYRLG